jgi:hypothetical protein
MTLMLAVGLVTTGPTPFALWFTFGWVMLAALVLPSTWAPVRVEGNLSGPRVWLKRRLPTLGQSLPRKWTLSAVVSALVGVLLWTWFAGGPLARFLVFVILGLIGVAAFLFWVIDTR